jgi:phosphomannomutase
MLAALHAIAALGTSDKSLSKLLKPYSKYIASGEINSKVKDAKSTMKKIESIYGAKIEIKLDHLDGLTVDSDSWWFNVRASNTEPLLRLNVEAKTEAQMAKIRDEVLELINS